MSYTPYSTSTNAAGTSGQSNAVILKLAATTTLTKNRFITLSSGDEDASIVCVGGVLAAPLSAISAATGAHTIANGNNTGQVWNWASTTNSTVAVTIGETTAATNGTSTNDIPNQVLLKLTTLASSTQSPLSVYSRGSHVFSISPTTAQIFAGLGTSGLPTYSFTQGITSGMYLDGTGRVSFAISGGDVLNINSGGPIIPSSKQLQLPQSGLSIVNAATGSDGLFFNFGVFGITVINNENTRFAAGLMQSSLGSANAIGYAINSRKSRGTVASPTVITTGDDLLTISGYGYVGATNTYLSAAQILFDSTGTITDTTSGIGGQIKFYTTKAGTDTSVQLAMTISGGSAALITLAGDLQLGNAYVATPQVGSGYVTIKDSTGTTYKVLVAA